MGRLYTTHTTDCIVYIKSEGIRINSVLVVRLASYLRYLSCTQAFFSWVVLLEGDARQIGPRISRANAESCSDCFLL